MKRPRVPERDESAQLALTLSKDLRDAVEDASQAGLQEAQRLEELVQRALDRLGQVVQGNGSSTSSGEAFAAFASSASRTLADHLARQREVLGTFNIALFGRTGAGKSSLLSALAELDGDRVSRGESDWTVDVEPVPWEGCLLYDTPGINGWGRTRSRDELELAARRAVEVSDVVLLCFDSQSQQALEFGKVARWVQEYGKPVIAVLNSRNLMWRDPARVPVGARENLSKSVREHAGNIRDELGAIGLAGTPVVAVQSQRALDARSRDPYKGPDAKNRDSRRRDLGPEYLYRWSNLPALEELIAATVHSGGAQLRLRVLREGVRLKLRELAEQIDSAAREARSTVDIAERSIEGSLAVLGYPERGDRELLCVDPVQEDALSQLEDLRGAPFTAPVAGRLENHVAQLAASRLGAHRAVSLKQASSCVRSAFEDARRVSDEEFRAAVFDHEALDAATSTVWGLAGEFLKRELDMTWEEGTTDLRREAAQVRVEGNAGRLVRGLGDSIRGAGILSGAAGVVLAVIAGTQFWNPAGWVAALTLLGTGLLSGFLGWLGKRTGEDAERRRLAARRSALGEVRLAVEDAYRELEDALVREVGRAAWLLHAGPLAELTGEAVGLHQTARSAEQLVEELQNLAGEIPQSPSPGAVLEGAARLVMASRPEGTTERHVWLGEDWIGDTASAVRAADDATALLGQRAQNDGERLSHVLLASFSSAQFADEDAWLTTVRSSGGLHARLSEVRDRAEVRRTTRPAVLFMGDYSAGKSSLVKRLLVDAGERPPADLSVRADPTTAVVREYPWRHLHLVDSPGLQSGRIGHDATALSSVDEAALVVVVLHVNLMIGDVELLRTVLGGSASTAPAFPRTLFLINRCDEFGVDPLGDPEEFLRRRARKEAELVAILRAQGFEQSAQLHTVSGDPYGLVGDRKDVTPADYVEVFRSWDGVAALATALSASDVASAAMRSRAAVATAVGGLLRLRTELNELVQRTERERAAAASLQRELQNAIDNGVLLAAALENRARAIVRTHAERAAAEALAATAEDFDRAASAVAVWWQTPEFLSDAASFWTRAQRDLDQWAKTSASAVTRSLPAELASAAAVALNPGQPPKWQGRGGGRRAAKASGELGRVAKALGHRDIVYKIGKSVGHKWKPWGAVKGAAKVSRVAAVLGVISVGLDVYGWVEDRNAGAEQERHRLALVDFVEASVQEVTEQLTRGAAPDGPLTVLEAALADYREAASDATEEIAERGESLSGLQSDLEEVARLLSTSPVPTS